MGENAVIGFVKRHASIQEVPVTVRNIGQVAGVKPRFAAIRVERPLATVVAKPIQCVEIVSGVEHHFIVIAQNRKHAALLRELD